MLLHTPSARESFEEVLKAMHEDQDGKHNFNISERLEHLRREREALQWEGTFRDYFELVTQNPRLAELSHARINDMIHAAGVDKLNEGTRDEVARYNFFAHELFGIEEPLARIVEYFKSAALPYFRNAVSITNSATMPIMKSRMSDEIVTPAASSRTAFA